MSYSRRQLEALGEPLGNAVTQIKPEGRGRVYGGGGGSGAPTQSTVTQTNIPEYARPYVEAMLGASLQNAFTGTQTGTGEDATYNITGVRPYQPYSLDPREYIAGFSPLQQAAFQGAGQLQVPGQIGAASDITSRAATGISGLAGLAPVVGQQTADVGWLGLDAARSAGQVGQRAADIGELALPAAQRGFGLGQQYFSEVSDPARIGSLMSPYMQNVVNIQSDAARRQAGITQQQRQAALTKAGAYGGARQAIEQAEANKALNAQLGMIQAQGLQDAYTQAIAQQQAGTQFGLQGMNAGYTGLGTALQGRQQQMQGVGTGLQGIGATLQGQQQQLQALGAGMQGYGQVGQLGQQLGGLGSQQLAAAQGILGLQQQYGGMQQQQEQNIINQAIQNYATAQQYPQMQLGFLNAMIRGIATPTTSTQTYQAAPSLTSQLAGLGTAGIAGLGLYNTMNAATSSR